MLFLQNLMNFIITKYLKQEVDDDLSVCMNELSHCGLSVTKGIKVYQCFFHSCLSLKNHPPPPPPPPSPPPPPRGAVIWQCAEILSRQKCFLYLWEDKPLWGELKLYGGRVIFIITTLSSFIEKQLPPRKVKCVFYEFLQEM